MICLVTCIKAQAEALTPTEKKIATYLAQEKKTELAMLEKLVNQNSGTTHLPGIYRIGKFFQHEFKKLGFKTVWVREPAALHRAGTLIAERRGSSGKRILLIGHLDTVFRQNSPFQHAHRHGNNITGPGIIDDKGGDVTILFALKALQHVNALKNTTIRIVLTGDEEDSGKPTAISRAPLIAAAKKSDVALDFECSLGLHTATIGRRGVSMWTLTTTGRGLHSAGIFQAAAGDGAIFELARILSMMQTQLSHEKFLSFNPGIVLAGNQIYFNQKNVQGTAMGKANIIAKAALAHGDLRFMNAAQQQQAESTMRVITAQHLPGTTATITFHPGIPAMTPTVANQALLARYSTVSQALGWGAVTALHPAYRGAGDISFVADLVGANLAGLGPVGYGAHSTEETLEVDSLLINTQRSALLIYRLIAPPLSS